METLYDVQQLLKQFGVYIYVGKRIYDIELMQIELENFYDSRLIDLQYPGEFCTRLESRQKSYGVVVTNT